MGHYDIKKKDSVKSHLPLFFYYFKGVSSLYSR